MTECFSCGLEFQVEHEYSYERDNVEVCFCPFCGNEIEKMSELESFIDEE